MVGFNHAIRIYKDDYVDTEYDRWVITEIDNHQIIWINLKYEFNNHRPSVDEEDESENSDSYALRRLNLMFKRLYCISYRR